MSKVTVYNLKGEKSTDVTLPEDVFGLPHNDSLVHQVYVAQTANRRSGSAHTKIRSDVRGGGKKPYKQKGTGQARTGSIRNPIWRGGGTVFGPLSIRNFSKNINTKMRRKALLVVLSDKARSGDIIIIDSLTMETPKTSVFAALHTKLIEGKSALIGLASSERSTHLAVRNIPKTRAMEVEKLNVLDLMETKKLVISLDAIDTIVSHFTSKEVETDKKSEKKTPEVKEA